MRNVHTLCLSTSGVSSNGSEHLTSLCIRNWNHRENRGSIFGDVSNKGSRDREADNSSSDRQTTHHHAKRHKAAVKREIFESNDSLESLEVVELAESNSMLQLLLVTSDLIDVNNYCQARKYKY